MSIKYKLLNQYLTIIFLFLLVCGPATAQSRLLDGSHFEPYSNKWHMYVVNPKGNEKLVRIWTDYAQVIRLNGKQYISRIQELYDPEMHLQELWANLYEHQTLLPYRASQFKTTGDQLYLEFDGTEVKTTTQQGGQKVNEQTYNLDEVVYDWTMYGALLSGIPFEKGKVTRIPVFLLQSPSGMGELIATAEAPEVITDERGNKHSTWRIQTNFGLTFWLSKEAPYIIQLSLPGQGGSYSIWKMF